MTTMKAKRAMKKREAVIFDGKCYNFALLFIQDRLVKEGRWTPEKAIKLSDRLSKEVKKTVKDFFRRQLPRMSGSHPS